MSARRLLALLVLCTAVACGSDDGDGGSSTGGTGGSAGSSSGGSAGSSSGGSAGSSSGGSAGAGQCQPACTGDQYCASCLGRSGVVWACIPKGSAC